MNLHKQETHTGPTDLDIVRTGMIVQGSFKQRPHSRSACSLPRPEQFVNSSLPDFWILIQPTNMSLIEVENRFEDCMSRNA